MRSIQATISTSKDGFELSVKETERIEDEEGNSHTESESSHSAFGQYKTAVEAASKTLARFEQKLKAAEGELFA